MGIPAEDGRLITHFIWADDTWLLAQSPGHLAEITTGLQEAIQKRTTARFGSDSHLPPTTDLPPMLWSMEHAQGSTRSRVLGDFVQADRGYSEEW